METKVEWWRYLLAIIDLILMPVVGYCALAIILALLTLVGLTVVEVTWGLFAIMSALAFYYAYHLADGILKKQCPGFLAACAFLHVLVSIVIAASFESGGESETALSYATVAGICIFITIRFYKKRKKATE